MQDIVRSSHSHSRRIKLRRPSPLSVAGSRDKEGHIRVTLLLVQDLNLAQPSLIAGH